MIKERQRKIQEKEELRGRIHKKIIASRSEQIQILVNIDRNRIELQKEMELHDNDLEYLAQVIYMDNEMSFKESLFQECQTMMIHISSPTDPGPPYHHDAIVRHMNEICVIFRGTNVFAFEEILENLAVSDVRVNLPKRSPNKRFFKHQGYLGALMTAASQDHSEYCATWHEEIFHVCCRRCQSEQGAICWTLSGRRTGIGKSCFVLR